MLTSTASDNPLDLTATEMSEVSLGSPSSSRRTSVGILDQLYRYPTTFSELKNSKELSLHASRSAPTIGRRVSFVTSPRRKLSSTDKAPEVPQSLLLNNARSLFYDSTGSFNARGWLRYVSRIHQALERYREAMHAEHVEHGRQRAFSTILESDIMAVVKAKEEEQRLRSQPTLSNTSEIRPSPLYKIMTTQTTDEDDSAITHTVLENAKAGRSAFLMTQPPLTTTEFHVANVGNAYLSSESQSFNFLASAESSAHRSCLERLRTVIARRTRPEGQETSTAATSIPSASQHKQAPQFNSAPVSGLRRSTFGSWPQLQQAANWYSQPLKPELNGKAPKDQSPDDTDSSIDSSSEHSSKDEGISLDLSSEKSNFVSRKRSYELSGTVPRHWKKARLHSAVESSNC